MVWVRQAADGDCAISIEDYSDLVNSVPKMGPGTTKLYRYFWFFGLYYNQFISVVPGLPNFLTRDLLTLNNSLSIPHSPRPLTTGPIGNVENMESLLAIDGCLHMYKLVKD